MFASHLPQTLVLACAGLAVSLAPLAAAPPPPMRYEIGLADGSRQEAHRITSWETDRQSLKLDDRQWAGSSPALRWIFDRRSEAAGELESWIETWTNDRLPGEVLSYVDGQSGAATEPAHLVMRSVTPTRPPQQLDHATVRIRTSSVRRIVWHNEGRHYQPGTVLTRDGRRIDFRALRWNSDSVTLLTNEGRHRLSFHELSELNLPQGSTWDELLEELALIAPHGTGPLIQIESSAGVIATTSWQRQRVARPQDPTKASHWMQGVHPAWSLDVLWVPGNEIPMRRFFEPHEVPLSRIPPARAVQDSPLAGQGRPWQRDRDVEGGWLESGPGVFGWGFGVHAHNELHFPLAPLARSFSGFVGIDAIAGAGGCVQARVLLRYEDTDTVETKTLFETPVITGSEQVYATGMRPLADERRQFTQASNSSTRSTAGPRSTLILQIDHAHAKRPPGADPLDIRDSADWLDPVLLLDPDTLHAQLAHRAISHITACRDWQWKVPKDGQVTFHTIWDELSQENGAFALGICVQGSEPLRLVTSQRLSPAAKQLVVTASCPLQTNPPVRIQVIANGDSLSEFDVPVLDRGHLELVPQVIPLHAVQADDDTAVEFQIRQLPGSNDAPVQWHSIEFR